MKEEDARKKWCPMSKVENINGNRSQTTANIEEARCIASDCMMWVEETATKLPAGISYVCGGHCGLIK